MALFHIVPSIIFKRNFQHESYRSQWDLKHLFTQLLLKRLGSQVINPWNHGHETKTLSEILSIFCQDFDLTSDPSFRVPFGFCKSDSKRGFRAHYEISKMSKNSLISFVRKENRRLEVGVSSCFTRQILWWTKFKSQAYAAQSCLEGL